MPDDRKPSTKTEPSPEELARAKTPAQVSFLRRLAKVRAHYADMAAGRLPPKPPLPEPVDDFDRIWRGVCDRWDTTGFAGLAPADQLVLAVGMLKGEIENGGLCQYMFNSVGDQAREAIAGLDELGLPAVAHVCRAFFALLPRGWPAADREAREAQLHVTAEHLGEEAFEAVTRQLEEAFYALTEDLYPRLLAYATEHGLGSSP